MTNDISDEVVEAALDEWFHEENWRGDGGTCRTLYLRDMRAAIRAQVANVEVGRSDIPTKTLQKFAMALECSMKDLVP